MCYVDLYAKLAWHSIFRTLSRPYGQKVRHEATYQVSHHRLCRPVPSQVGLRTDEWRDRLHSHENLRSHGLWLRARRLSLENHHQRVHASQLLADASHFRHHPLNVLILGVLLFIVICVRARYTQA